MHPRCRSRKGKSRYVRSGDLGYHRKAEEEDTGMATANDIIAPSRTSKRSKRFRFALATTLFGAALGTAGGLILSGTTATASTAIDPFTSSWDLPLASGASVVSGSSTMVSNLVTQYQNNYGSVTVNGGNWGGSSSTNAYDGIPIVTVAANQALVPIKSAPAPGDGGSSCNTFNVYGGAGTGPDVPIPSSAASLIPDTGDSSLIVYQPSTSTEWEFWETAYSSSNGWTACDGGKITNLSASDGVFSEPGGYGLSAAGISYLGTAITEADVASGSINHTLALQVVHCNGGVAPANRTDCGSRPGQVSEGSWLRFPTTLAMPKGLTPFAQMVFKAMQTYGAVVTDQSGSVSIAAENGYDWTYEGHSGTDPITSSWDGQPAYAALDGVPWGQLEVVSPTQTSTPDPGDVSTLALPAGAVNQHYELALSDTKTFRWKLALGKLPLGLHLSPNGVIHGKPRTAGNTTVVVEMRKAGQDMGAEVLTIHIS